jgi:hypothetical protein
VEFKLADWGPGGNATRKCLHKGIGGLGGSTAALDLFQRRLGSLIEGSASS